METTSLFIVVAFTVFAFFVASFSYGEAHLKHIKENWVKYRCNPIYMPLAGYVGSDILSNFMGCTMTAFQTYVGFALDPIYSMFAVVGTAITDIQGTLNDFRDMISGTKNAFLSIISDTYGKIQNTLSSTVHLLNRIRTLNNRLIALFVTVFHMVTTGVQTGESVANGPIGQAISFFCFSPLTRVRMLSGTMKFMKDCQPGETLCNGDTVESVLILSGKDVPIYRLDGIYVSGNHKVYSTTEGKWIRVDAHPESTKMSFVSYDYLVCLNTKRHTIPVGSHLFKDYEETSSPVILAKFTGMVEMLHNGTLLPKNKPRRTNPLEYRRSGAAPRTKVLMEDKTMKELASIKIGDRVAKGGAVLGTVKHMTTNTPVVLPSGIEVTKATWVFDTPGHAVYTAEAVGNLVRSDDIQPYYLNLLTEEGYVTLMSPKGENTAVILDDQETTEDWVHSWRDVAVQKETFA
jgi:hypothetical protein